MQRDSLKIYTEVSGGADIPFHNIKLTEYSYKETRMGMPSLKATLMFDSCLDDEWTGAEYVTFNSERFHIRSTPQSSKANTDRRFRHEIEFISERDQILANTYFRDAVFEGASTYDRPCSNSTKFIFYGTLREFVDRLNCVFRYLGIGDTVLNGKTDITTTDTLHGDGYCAVYDVYGDFDHSDIQEVSFEDCTLWEAISRAYEKYKVPFKSEGRAFVFGSASQIVDHVFRYGHSDSLLSINKKNADAKIVNRITMLGSTENIPYYYPNETEYGHIVLQAGENNAALQATSFEIANLTQLIANVPPGSKAELIKYSGNFVDTGISVKSYTEGFNTSNMSAYMVGDIRKHEADGRTMYVPWHIGVNLKVIRKGIYSIDEVTGNIWTTNTTRPPTEHTVKIHAELLRTASGSDITAQLVEEDGIVSLGQLEAGDYYLQFYIDIPNRRSDFDDPVTAFCRMSGVTFFSEAATTKDGYYWKVDDKEYADAGSLGLKLKVTLTDEMVGDSIGWDGTDRMPFQENLMPSIYRETLGGERFYNALNETYKIPGTDDFYVFPHPFQDKRPSEYIFKDESIKPTIAGIKNTSNKLFGAIAAVEYDSDDNDLLETESVGDTDKNNSKNYQHSYFYIKLNVFDGPHGFDLFSHASQTAPMTIQMTSGPCAGCKFKIQAVEIETPSGLKTYSNPVQTMEADGRIVSGSYEQKVNKDNIQPWQQDTTKNSIWIAVQKDSGTFGVIMPNRANNYRPQVGDEFNIINIDLPLSYITAAELRLEQAGIQEMADNNEEHFSFDISMSRIFLEENPSVRDQINANSIIKIEYNGHEIEQFVSSVEFVVKDSDVLPELRVNLVEELTVGESFINKVAASAVSMLPSATPSPTYGSRAAGMRVSDADRRYLNKQRKDRTPHILSSDAGFEVGEFTSGSSGGLFYRDSETGLTHLETDMLHVRMKAIFEELEIAHISAVGGELMLTPGGSVEISYVEELSNAYRCYFKAKESDHAVECRFAVGDDIICREFNVTSGSTQNAANKFYWRRIVGVDNDKAYFDVSRSICLNGSDIPAPGDTVCQFGSNDVTRRSAIVLSTTDSFAPCITLLNGVTNFSTTGKDAIQFGVDKSKNPPEPFLHCYGSFFFGPRSNTSYLQFEPSEGSLVFKGKLSAESLVGDKAIDEYIRDVAPTLTEDEINNFINAVVDPKIEGIQDQIDGVIETWFHNGEPRMDNYPANEWVTQTLLEQHLGDLYYDNETGIAYRFSYNPSLDEYFWNEITDSAVVKALQEAYKAQGIGNAKKRVFTAQPTPPYDKGDMWVNATYGTSYNNDILVCTTARATGGRFFISDWKKASDYTDDTKALEIDNKYKYLAAALADTTEINGGLILTSLIKLGRTINGERKVMAGMNGTELPSAAGRSIGSWWGGDCVDLYNNDDTLKNPEPADAATALIRMDGSGYLANGNFGWDLNGAGWFAGKNITWDATGAMKFGSGIKISINGGETGLSESLESIYNYFIGLNNYLYPTDESGNRVGWNETNKIKAIKSSVGFFSDSFISARGINTSGGSGGGGSSFGLTRTWPTTAPSQSTNNALSDYLGWQLKEQIANIPTSYSWSDLKNKPTTVSDFGITDVYTSTQSDSRYVAKSGGNLTGSINMLGNAELNIRMRVDTSNVKGVCWKNTSDETIAQVIYHNTPQRFILNPNGAETPWSDKAGNYSLVIGVDRFTYNANTIWHSGNDGDGSGLDADTVDGIQETSLFRTNRGAAPSDFVDLSNEDPYHGFVKLNSGTYLIQSSDHSELLVNFALNTGSTSAFQFRTNYTKSSPVYFRKNVDSTHTSGAWSYFITNDNISVQTVASAAKLNTPRYLWGQLFDGTGNVSGPLVGTSHIVPDEDNTRNIGTTIRHFRYIFANWIGHYTGRFQLGAANGYDITIAEDHNVGIGTDSPQYKCHVDGIVYSTVGMLSAGYMTCRQTGSTSDARMKTIERYFTISPEDIAAAPSIKFRWKDNHTEDVGSIAQYWANIAPETVFEDGRGMLNLEYGKLGLLSAISLAKEYLSLREKMESLEARLKRIEEKLSRL